MLTTILTLMVTTYGADIVVMFGVIPCLECNKYQRQCRNAKVIRDAIYKELNKEI